jgi:hypothetical protein
MDNFFRRHRCTLDVRPCSGARSVLVTPARPAFLAVLCVGILFVFSALAPAPKPFRFVLPKLRHALFCPEPNSRPSYHACGWSGNVFFPNPLVKRSALNSELTRRF